MTGTKHFLISSLGLLIFLVTVTFNVGIVEEKKYEPPIDKSFISFKHIEKEEQDDVYCLIPNKVKKDERKCYKFDYHKKDFVEIEPIDN